MDAKSIQEKFEQLIPFIKRNCMEILEIDHGYVKMRANLQINKNHFGSMYAGALFTLGELPGGALYLSTFNTSKFFPLVKTMIIDFINPAFSDATVEVRISDEEIERISSEAERDGKSDFALEAEIKDENGQVIAVCRGAYQMRKKEKLS